MIDGARRFLVFKLQGTDFALNLSDVAEVVEPPPVFPVPRAPRHLLGVMNFHGALVSILDLANFQNLGFFAPGGKVLVLDSRLASLALWVDGVSAVISEESIRNRRAGDNGIIAERLHTDSGEINLLSLDWLLLRLEATIND